MPWVRLHGTRGYRDVPRIISETRAQVTVNLVATLVEQIEHYAGGGSDLHLDLCRKPAEALTPVECNWILHNFLHGSDRAYAWFEGWGALRARRERGDVFTTNHLRDLQVWCNLAWFGATAVEDFPVLGELRRKGAGFTEAEKSTVLSIQFECLRSLRSLYQALPDISASPYAHPILPLLVNTAHARRNLGDIPDPGFRRAEDALAQLKLGREIISDWVGRAVEGLWPSEGSVSPEVIELAQQAGFSWFASDEGVLARSERQGHGPTWAVGGLRGLFRDHGLSDRIGFVYADWPGKKAATDLIEQIDGRDIVLVLDGENPWEAHRDAGAGFMRALFTQAKTRTCSALAAMAPTGRVNHLHTGSWIGADFRIWIGDEADRAAWTLLRAVRDTCDTSIHVSNVSPNRDVSLALFRAEASDWFWWYGPEFSTPFAGEFDELFRAHLRMACLAAGVPVPAEVERPLTSTRSLGSPPTGTVYPERSDWFAWANAGFLQLSGAAMAHGEGAFVRLEYGWAHSGFVCRLQAPDGWSVDWQSAADGAVYLQFIDPAGTRHPPQPGQHLPPPPARP